MIHNQCATIPSVEGPDTEGHCYGAYCEAFDKTRPSFTVELSASENLVIVLSSPTKAKTVLKDERACFAIFVQLARSLHQNPYIQYPGNYQKDYEWK